MYVTIAVKQLSVYGPTRLTHSASHGVLITILGWLYFSHGVLITILGWLYFSVQFLLTWNDLYGFVMDWMVVRIPFQHIAAFMPWVLEIEVVPHRCSPLQWIGYDQPSFVTDACLILDNSKF